MLTGCLQLLTDCISWGSISPINPEQGFFICFLPIVFVSLTPTYQMSNWMGCWLKSGLGIGNCDNLVF